ncbi:MAG: flagellar motor protein MotB, partial [Myxococcota bacterium]
GERARGKALVDEKATLVADRAKLKGSVDEMKIALAELESRKALAEARIAEYQGLLARFKKLIDAGKLTVKIVDGRMVVALATDILFSSGSAELSADGNAAIAEVAQVLVAIPDRAYQIEGHTDNVPIRTDKYPSNWELASARALTVVRSMIAAGMPPTRVSAASYGEFKPTAANDSSTGRSSNRRIEIVVVPDLSNLPGFEELRKASAE